METMGRLFHNVLCSRDVAPGWLGHSLPGHDPSARMCMPSEQSEVGALGVCVFISHVHVLGVGQDKATPAVRMGTGQQAGVWDKMGGHPSGMATGDAWEGACMGWDLADERP